MTPNPPSCGATAGPRGPLSRRRQPVVSCTSRLEGGFLEPRVLFSLAAGGYEGWYSGRVITGRFLVAGACDYNCSVILQGTEVGLVTPLGKHVFAYWHLVVILIVYVFFK